MRAIDVSGRARAFAVLVMLVAVGRGGTLQADEPRVIAISARRFEFTPKEITLKLGETVKLELSSQDVTHGFFSKPLGIDELIVPGKLTEVLVTPRSAGRYTTICDHFCGGGHGGMKLTIVVE